MVPVVPGFMLCGLTVSLFAEAQYEYVAMPSAVSVLPDLV